MEQKIDGIEKVEPEEVIRYLFNEIDRLTAQVNELELGKIESLQSRQILINHVELLERELAEYRGEMKTAYDEEGTPYLVEAEGSEAEHIIELLTAEGDGRLYITPCKIREAVYVIDTDPEVDSYIEERFIDNIVICEDGEILLKGDSYDDVICTAENIIHGTPYLDYYRVFLTREEAEAALERKESE